MPASLHTRFVNSAIAPLRLRQLSPNWPSPLIIIPPRCSIMLLSRRYHKKCGQLGCLQIN